MGTTPHSPLLLRLMARLGELEVQEKFLPTERGYVYGMTDGDGIIYVNPVPHIVDTVIHEILHEFFPKHSERAILSLTGKVMHQLSDADLQAIYSEYRRKIDA